MARTMQVARHSTGGKPPRKEYTKEERARERAKKAARSAARAARKSRRKSAPATINFIGSYLNPMDLASTIDPHTSMAQRSLGTINNPIIIGDDSPTAVAVLPRSPTDADLKLRKKLL